MCFYMGQQNQVIIMKKMKRKEFEKFLRERDKIIKRLSDRVDRLEKQTEVVHPYLPYPQYIYVNKPKTTQDVPPMYPGPDLTPRIWC